MLAASISATTLALSGSSLAASTLASNFAKRPVTVVNMAGCLTLNSTLEWAGSADQVPAGTMVLPACLSGSTTTLCASFKPLSREDSLEARAYNGDDRRHSRSDQSGASCLTLD